MQLTCGTGLGLWESESVSPLSELRWAGAGLAAALDSRLANCWIEGGKEGWTTTRGPAGQSALTAGAGLGVVSALASPGSSAELSSQSDTMQKSAFISSMDLLGVEGVNTVFKTSLLTLLDKTFPVSQFFSGLAVFSLIALVISNPEESTNFNMIDPEELSSVC